MNLNKLRDAAYKNACNKGFHDKEYSNEHCLMLVITELSEAVEADRKGKRAETDAFKAREQDTELFDMWIDYNELIKGSVEEELTDAVIRLLDLAGLRGVDLTTLNNSRFVTKGYDGYSFTECVFAIIRSVGTQKLTLDHLICGTLYFIFCLSNHLNIDLTWHIKQKMKYNEIRPYKHGKKY